MLSPINESYVSQHKLHVILKMHKCILCMYVIHNIKISNSMKHVCQILTFQIQNYFVIPLSKLKKTFYPLEMNNLCDLFFSSEGHAVISHVMWHCFILIIPSIFLLRTTIPIEKKLTYLTSKFYSQFQLNVSEVPQTRTIFIELICSLALI